MNTHVIRLRPHVDRDHGVAADAHGSGTLVPDEPGKMTVPLFYDRVGHDAISESVEVGDQSVDWVREVCMQRATHTVAYTHADAHELVVPHSPIDVDGVGPDDPFGNVSTVGRHFGSANIHDAAKDMLDADVPKRPGLRSGCERCPAKSDNEGNATHGILEP